MCPTDATPARPAPGFLFLSINEVCNLHCRHCNYWKVKKPSLLTIDLHRTTKIIEEFAEISPAGKVVICGGEPMLDVNTYFEVCRISRKLGLPTLSVTNGTLIDSLPAAERIVREGPDEISISLDGPTPEIHDRMRRQKGAFLAATSALIYLLRARTKSSDLWSTRRPTTIYTMGLLGNSTYRLLPEFYALVLDQIGTDKLKLNAIQPSFLNTTAGQLLEADDNFRSESQVDPDVLLRVLRECDERWHLHLNPTWISQVASYFRALWKKPNLELGWRGDFGTSEKICNSGDRNLMVDVRGRASLCFSNHFPSRELVWKGDLRTFWEDPGCREEMSKCRALCGINHSVRAVSATTRKQPR